MASEAARALAEKAIADYGFRQALLWGTDEVLAAWPLDPAEAEAVRSRLLAPIAELPVPVEPGQRPAVLERLLQAIEPAAS